MSLRILQVIKGLGQGGAEQLVLETSRHLNSDLFRPEVCYLLPWKDALLPALDAAGIPVSCLGHRSGWPSRLRRLVSAHAIDIVHLHSPYPAAIARFVLGQGVKLVYTEHNVWPRYRGPTRWANRLTYQKNDHVFAVSEEVRTSIVSVLGPRSPQVEVLHHGIDLTPQTGSDAVADLRTELGIGPDDPIIGTVANLKHHKGHSVFMKAMGEIRRAVPDVRWILIGGGPLKDEIETSVRTLDLEGHVFVLGSRSDARKLIPSFDIFVLPSLHEGLPMALLEAMVAACPIVATEVGGIGEVLEDGREGILVPPNDQAALARAVVTLLKDPDRARSLGHAARERSQRYDIRKTVRRIETVYRQLGDG